MAFPLCFSFFFHHLLHIKKGRRMRWLDYHRKIRNQLHNFLFVSFFHYSNLLLEREELGIIDDCRILGRQLNYNLLQKL